MRSDPKGDNLRPTLEQARHALRNTYGYDDFRPAQIEVLQPLLEEGRDVFAILATGLGKSVIYQIPAMLYEGTVLVISPLIALMRDQVANCQAAGISAACIHSNMDADEITQTVRRFVRGEYRLLYVSPERLGSGHFRNALASTPISIVAIDEVHAASRWGHDFRPDYMLIGRRTMGVRDVEGNRPPRLALTATATADIQADVARAVQLEPNHALIVGDPIRPNLHYDVRDATSDDSACWTQLRLVARQQFHHARGRAVVYSGTTAGTEKISQILSDMLPHLPRSNFGFYHGKMDAGMRKHMQDGFKDSSIPIMSATNAFGMGIDVPDIRTIISFGIPAGVEDYTQQTGRGGRDGGPCQCVLIADLYSRELQRRFVTAANPELEAYAAVWTHLTDVLGVENAEIRLSAAKLLDQMKEAQREGPIEDPRQVDVVMQQLKSRGLIERTPIGGESPITFEAGKLKALIPDLSPGQRTVVEYLLSLPARSTHFIDKKAMAASTRLSSPTVHRILSGLRDTIVGGQAVLTMEPAFTGSATRLTRLGSETVDVYEVIPTATIERKRTRDLRRLECMIAYSSLKGGYEDYIRGYFRGEMF
jgi:RecQ family ATP-dependent DNA helicase